MCLCVLFAEYVARRRDRSTNSYFANVLLCKFVPKVSVASFRQNFVLSSSNPKLGDMGPWDLKLLHLLKLYMLWFPSGNKNYLLLQMVTSLVTTFPVSMLFSYCTSTNLVWRRKADPRIYWSCSWFGMALKAKCFGGTLYPYLKIIFKEEWKGSRVCSDFYREWYFLLLCSF